MPVKNQSEFLLLFALVQRVRRLTQAFLRLQRSGFVSEASLLVRAALEHAVTAQWAYLTPGGVTRLHVSCARAQAAVAAGMTSYSKDPGWIDLEARLRADVPAGPGLPKFTGREGIMAELDSIHFLSASYRVLSQVGHVTHQAALDFLVEEEGEVHLRAEPEVLEQEQLRYALSGFCMLVAWIQARLEEDNDEVARLKEIAVRLHVPWRLDTHLPPIRRRFSGEET